jgi:hypothetical protein
LAQINRCPVQHKPQDLHKIFACVSFVSSIGACPISYPSKQELAIGLPEVFLHVSVQVTTVLIEASNIQSEAA